MRKGEGETTPAPDVGRLPIETEIYGVLDTLGIETGHAEAQAIAAWAKERIADALAAVHASETLKPRQPISDEESRDLLQTMDGAKWANAFCRATGFPDEGWALTWFCNAIMAGVDETNRRVHASETILRQQLNHAVYVSDKRAAERDVAEAQATTLREERDALQRQVDQLLPCPDCRDKVRHEGCQRCARQKAEEEVEALRQEHADLQQALDALGKQATKFEEDRLKDAEYMLQERKEVQGLIETLNKHAHPATSTWSQEGRDVFGICADLLTRALSGAIVPSEAQKPTKQ